MKIEIKFFGQLAELTGKINIEVNEVNDTDSLIKKMLSAYPVINEFNFLVTVDKKLVKGNQKLEDGCEVAFLPPFSGG